MSLGVIKAGLLDTLQDFGRKGFASKGFANCGVMDFYTPLLLNILLDNPLNEAVLEMILTGGEYEFLESNVFCIGGAQCNATLNSQSLENYTVYQAKAGDILKIGMFTKGMATYLGIGGGFLPTHSDMMLRGSKSTDTKLNIGGFQGRKLQSGDVVAFCKSKLYNDMINIDIRNLNDWLMKASNRAFRVIIGPQDSFFTKNGLQTLFTKEYMITPQSNRMGLRLKGEAIQYANTENMRSDGVSFGSIQIPKDGQPIILMVDRQITGGYPKIGNIISYDLPLLAQTRFGIKIRFKHISIQKAQLLLKHKQQKILNLHYKINEKWQTTLW